MYEERGDPLPEFEVIYKEHFQDVYKYILSICMNESLAEEITQEAFYKALNHFDSFDGRCRLYVWLCQIAKNTLFTYQKKQKRQSDAYQDSVLPDTTITLEANLIERENICQLLELIKQLKDPYREVFLLRVIGELSFSRIGTLFGKSDSWARLVYYRAKMEVRREFDESSL